MDEDVATAVATGLASFSTDALAQFALVIPIGIGIAVAVAVTFASIKWLRGMVHI